MVDAGNDAEMKNYELSLDFTVADLKGLVEADTGLSASKQLMAFRGQPLQDDAQTLAVAGVSDQDMLSVTETGPRRQAPPPRQNLGDAESVQRIEGLRQQLLTRLRNSPQERAQMHREASELVESLDNPDRFRDVFFQQQGMTLQRRQQVAAEMQALNDDMSEEGQAKIYEAIRQSRVAQEAEMAMEEHPELFGRVTMLYVNVAVNGHPVKAFVDSGAQATIMSPSCAEACNVTKSIDTRFAGIARGVGTAKILGRVHSATMTIGDFKDYELPCAFTVMEGKDVDMLLGLDMLKRYQATIDLQKNKLILGGGSISVPFLDEAEIPRSFEESIDNEPTVPGPGGASIGVESGAVKPPPNAVPSSKASSSFSGKGQTLGSSSSAMAQVAPPPASSASQAPAQAIPQTPVRSSIPPRPAAPTPGAAQFPESSIEIITNLGASREEAIEALRACDGQVEYAASMFFG